MCNQWQYLADPFVADELCNYRGCQAESLNHPEALFHMNTGSRLGGDPALGAWATYGLGDREPKSSRLSGDDGTRASPRRTDQLEQWLPATALIRARDCVRRARRCWISRRSLTSRAPHQRRALDELAWLNKQHLESVGGQDEKLAARIESYELAFRMQSDVPDVIDLKQETRQTLDMYGLDEPETKTFGRQCLMARRLVEKGVRFVQIFSGGWDSHDYLERGHTGPHQKAVDKPMAALIRDLKQRGMLDDTLVIWTGEFGRTPDNNKRVRSLFAGTGPQQPRHDDAAGRRRSETRSCRRN